MAAAACFLERMTPLPAALAAMSSTRSSSSSTLPLPSGSRVARRPGASRLHVVSKMPEPGMYGGTPDRKFRRSWGGEARKDPLETGDYLWDNREDWKRVLDHELQQASQPPATSSGSPSASPGQRRGDGTGGSGFLSLGRSLALDSMDVDLSRELMPVRTVSLEDQVEAARAAAGERLLGGPANVEVPPADGSIKWRSVHTPSARESLARRKSMSFSAKPGSYMAASTPQSEEEQERLYQQLKNKLQLYTLGLGVCFSVSAAFTYSPAVAASFSAGAVGSLMYVRMLTTSVEALGKSGLESAARGSAGSPRLLVPVILVMAYNRWNTVVAPEYGLAELQLIPMLLGFLTYKAATIIQTFEDVLVPTTENTSNPTASTDDT